MAHIGGSILTGSIDTNRSFSANRSYCKPLGIVSDDDAEGPFVKMGLIPSLRHTRHAFRCTCDMADHGYNTIRHKDNGWEGKICFAKKTYVSVSEFVNMTVQTSILSLLLFLLLLL